MATDVFCHVDIKNKGDRDHGTYDLIRIKKLQAAELACNQPDPFPEFQFHSGPKEHFFNDTWPPELSGLIFEDLQQVIDAAEPFSDAVYEEQLSKIRGWQLEMMYCKPCAPLGRPEPEIAAYEVHCIERGIDLRTGTSMHADMHSQGPPSGSALPAAASAGGTPEAISLLDDDEDESCFLGIQLAVTARQSASLTAGDIALPDGQQGPLVMSSTGKRKRAVNTIDKMFPKLRPAHAPSSVRSPSRKQRHSMGRPAFVTRMYSGSRPLNLLDFVGPVTTLAEQQLLQQPWQRGDSGQKAEVAETFYIPKRPQTSLVCPWPSDPVLKYYWTRTSVSQAECACGSWQELSFRAQLLVYRTSAALSLYRTVKVVGDGHPVLEIHMLPCGHSW
ncbi:hypothetical protein WJX84_003743 [Apatococcus fuscideae]|uniref:Uncharacterized protein n=1 Tax=Apatococcus fuscideae TaxID=2026836 RepID=A0AAW1RL31_9CHLO